MLGRQGFAFFNSGKGLSVCSCK